MATADSKLVPLFDGWDCPLDSILPMAPAAPQRPRTAVLGGLSADGHFPYALTVPGSLWAGPCDPGGAPYGRTEVGRSRRMRGRSTGVGMGLNLGILLQLYAAPSFLIAA